MHPLHKTQLMAQLYMDLAIGYQRTFGNDEFVRQVTREALQLHPTNITAHLTKANYTTEMIHYVFDQIGITQDNIEEIRKYPKVMQLFQNRVQQQKTIDALGYKEMPDEAYQKWLTQVNREKSKQQQAELEKQFKKINTQSKKI